MTDFYEWNYDTGKITLWQRNGECNHCGQCCKDAADIGFDVASSMEIKPGQYQENYNTKNGGDTTSGKVVWSEGRENKRRVFFGNIRRLNKTGYTPCEMWKNERCSMHDEKPNICKLFPMSPHDVVMFNECSYSFEKIEEWDMSEMDKR
jgi:Fe-S-cluster containining protein